MKSQLFKPLSIALFAATFVLAVAVSSKLTSFDLRSRAFYKPARIVIDMAALPGDRINTEFIRAFAQGGEEKKDMIGPVLGQVTSLHPTIIRLDHIYDYYNVVGDDGTVDFSHLDDAVKSIRLSGAVPMLSLSYMPALYSSDGSLTGLPKDWMKWSDLVTRTIERYSGKTAQNIPGVYYEVWNEPDHEQFGGFKTYGNKNYLDLYKASQKGAQNATNTNDFFLGGPSTTGYYKAWIEAMVKAGLRVDFFSFHVYSDDTAKPREDLANIRQLLSGFDAYKDTALIITELGFDSKKNEKYSGKFAAAFTAGVFRQLLDNPPHAVMSFELKDGPNEEGMNGWGIITHESKGGIRKARYYVYPFLETFTGVRLPLEGEGTNILAAGARDDEVVRILLTSYSSGFVQSETAPITIKNIPDGSYVVSTQYLLGTTDVRTHQAENSTLTFITLMTPYSVVRIDIEPEK